MWNYSVFQIACSHGIAGLKKHDSRETHHATTTFWRQPREPTTQANHFWGEATGTNHFSTTFQPLFKHFSTTFEPLFGDCHGDEALRWVGWFGNSRGELNAGIA
jgi:hypothetical protein